MRIVKDVIGYEKLYSIDNICVDENKEFNSIKECAKYYGVTSGMICKVLNGTFKTTHGLSFKYKEVI